MDRFVCVRMVKANGIDLARFQFDYDLTFAVFFMNADGTIYGRYGSRSSMKDADRDISIDGFRKALAAALELHEQYPANKASLAGKRGPRPRFARPELYPWLRRYDSKLDYAGKVAQSCIHCHQVRDAEIRFLRDARRPAPDRVIYPWPMPDVVGLSLDSGEKASVREVAPGSPAARAGFRRGDEIVSLQAQPILSIADVQWVLHQADDPDTLTAEVLRDGRRRRLTLTLPKGWRSNSDISWRPTSWNLRRIATGGLRLEPLSEEDRRRLGIARGRTALRVDHVGQYGEHAAAKRAGFRRGDVIVEFDDRDDVLSETDVFAHVLKERMAGAQVPVTVIRDGRRLHFKLPTR